MLGTCQMYSVATVYTRRDCAIAYFLHTNVYLGYYIKLVISYTYTYTYGTRIYRFVLSHLISSHLMFSQNMEECLRVIDDEGFLLTTDDIGTQFCASNELTLCCEYRTENEKILLLRKVRVNILRTRIPTRRLFITCISIFAYVSYVRVVKRYSYHLPSVTRVYPYTYSYSYVRVLLVLELSTYSYVYLCVYVRV